MLMKRVWIQYTTKCYSLPITGYLNDNQRPNKGFATIICGTYKYLHNLIHIHTHILWAYVLCEFYATNDDNWQKKQHRSMLGWLSHCNLFDTEFHIYTLDGLRCFVLVVSRSSCPSFRETGMRYSIEHPEIVQKPWV